MAGDPHRHMAGDANMEATDLIPGSQLAAVRAQRGAECDRVPAALRSVDSDDDAREHSFSLR